jgi:large subunit ribosomal protein L25
MSSYDLKAQKRTASGKGGARKLRAEGRVPGVAYGKQDAPETLSVDARDLWDVTARHHSHGLLNLKFDDGSSLPVIIKSIQRHPVTHRPSSIDFLRVNINEEVEATVPIALVGESQSMKDNDGILVQSLHELHIRALPGDLPETIEVDISGLEFNGAPIHVSEVTLPQGITMVTNGEEAIAVVNPPDVEPIVEEPMDPADVEAIEQGESDAEEQDKDKDGK